MAVSQVVAVDGLQSRADLNGHFAVVLEIGERWRCQVVATGERVRLKPTNVTFLSVELPADGEGASASREPRKVLRAADFPTLQAAVDAAPPEGALIHVETNYNEVVKIKKPVSLIGISDSSGEADEKVKQRRCIAGIEVDLENTASNLVEIRNLQLGCAAAWLRGAGLRVYDGSPVVVGCTIGGMFAVRVDSFKVRSCPALLQNRLEGRIGGIWWDGACWEALPTRGKDALPISPVTALEVGGVPKFVLEVASENSFSGDPRWVCCIDSGVWALLGADKGIPLEVPGPEAESRQAMAAEIKATSWYVHRPTLALMERQDRIKQRAAWALLGSEDENAVRLEVQSKKMYAEAEQIRHWRDCGMLLPEDINDALPPLPEGSPNYEAKITELPPGCGSDGAPWPVQGVSVEAAQVETVEPANDFAAGEYTD